MLDTIETILLRVLPYAFGLKTIVLGAMWAHLHFETTPLGPLGEKINTSFRDITIMSFLLTWLMVILRLSVDASDIEWPVTSIALFGLSIWPLRVAWTHWRVYRLYRHMARDKMRGAS